MRIEEKLNERNFQVRKIRSLKFFNYFFLNNERLATSPVAALRGW